MAGSAGSGGNAGSTDNPDGGIPPEPAPTCTDQLRNGDETGVDCGGSCAACQKACDCASSAALTPLGCELTSSFGTVQGSPHPLLSATADIVTFDLCYEDGRCRIFQANQGGEVQGISVPEGATLAGASLDGARVLYSPQVTLGGSAVLADFDGHATQTGLLPTPALLAANGTAVGLSSTGNSSQLARTPADGQLQELGSLPFTRNNLILTAVSPDGSAIDGYGYSNNIPHPFRWTEAGGLVLDFLELPENVDGASVHAMNSDGTVVAGLTWRGYEGVDVYRWSATGGLSQVAQTIAIPPPGADATGMALSADGSVLTGLMAASDLSFAAFRWTEATGAVNLTPGVESMASHLSVDGNVVVGQTLDFSDYGGFVWTAAHGPRVIRSTLESAGVDFRGWHVTPPTALSADGRIVVGLGTCGSTPTIYRMVLPD
jgi:uncharacterized membrane protein